MTREEALEILRKHNEWRRYIGPLGEGPEMTEPKTLGEAIDVITSQPSLPANVDEAAEEAGLKVLSPVIDGSGNDKCYVRRYEFIRGFKAGAEWMAGQGETIETAARID